VSKLPELGNKAPRWSTSAQGRHRCRGLHAEAFLTSAKGSGQKCDERSTSPTMDRSENTEPLPQLLPHPSPEYKSTHLIACRSHPRQRFPAHKLYEDVGKCFHVIATPGSRPPVCAQTLVHGSSSSSTSVHFVGTKGVDVFVSDAEVCEEDFVCIFDTLSHIQSGVIHLNATATGKNVNFTSIKFSGFTSM
jgi:hypothetical protein